MPVVGKSLLLPNYVWHMLAVLKCPCLVFSIKDTNSSMLLKTATKTSCSFESLFIK